MSASRRSRAAAYAAALSASLVAGLVGIAGTAPATENLGCSDVVHQEQAPGCEPHRLDLAGGGLEDEVTGEPATTPPTAAPDGEDDGLDCSSFHTHADAQAALTEGTGEPAALDTDDDGIACEQHFGTEGQQVAVHPDGAVAAGGGPRR